MRHAVKDFMTSAVVTVGPNIRVDNVAQLFLDKRISGAPVVDAYQNMIGIVSEGDLIRRLEETDGANPTVLDDFNLLPARRSARWIM